jgi:hypothetical protein
MVMTFAVQNYFWGLSLYFCVKLMYRARLILSVLYKISYKYIQWKLTYFMCTDMTKPIIISHSFANGLKMYTCMCPFLSG